MRVLITGAAGAIGRELAAELAEDHELCLTDRTPLSKQASVAADLAECSATWHWNIWRKTRHRRWKQLFEGTDVVVHLAGNRNVEAAWEDLLSNNIRATWNVIEMAARHSVPRVIFASSNWVVKTMEQRLAPACYLPDGPKIGSDVSPCPTNAYGLSKACGEMVGRTFVDQHKLQSFVAVRIGYYGPPALHQQELSSLWIGAGDIRSLFRRCVEAEYDDFHVVYAVSAQKTAPYDLSHTTQLLSWSPQQLPRHPESLNSRS